MKNTTYILMLSFSLLLACGKSNKSGGSNPAVPNYNLIQAEDAPYANDLIAQINQRRIEGGLAPLERTALLDSEAQTQAVDRLNSQSYRSNVRYEAYGSFNLYGYYGYYNGGTRLNSFNICDRVTDRFCEAIGVGVGSYNRANLSPVQSVLRRIQSDRSLNIMSHRYQRVGLGLARNLEGRSYWVVVFAGY